MIKTGLILFALMFLVTSDQSHAGIGPGVGIMNSAILGAAILSQPTDATWSDGTAAQWSDGTAAQWSGS